MLSRFWWRNLSETASYLSKDSSRNLWSPGLIKAVYKRRKECLLFFLLLLYPSLLFLLTDDQRTCHGSQCYTRWCVSPPTGFVFPFRLFLKLFLFALTALNIRFLWLLFLARHSRWLNCYCSGLCRTLNTIILEILLLLSQNIQQEFTIVTSLKYYQSNKQGDYWYAA